MELKYKINTRSLLLVLIGAIMACSSYLIFVYDPLQQIIKKMCTLQPGSFLLHKWADPPHEVLINIFIFNVTNSEEFLNGTEKMNFQEIGPYTYQEFLTNTNATFNANGTMTFKPRRKLVFRRDLSIGDPMADRILSPNIPLIGITSSLKEASMFTNLAVSTISNMLGSKGFLNITISEYLWGYDDKLVTLAHQAIPTWINFDRFGIMDRLMALDNASNIVTLNTHPEYGLASGILTEEERKQDYHIHRWNGSPGLKQWGYEETNTSTKNCRCNMVEGSFEGTAFPPNIKENTTFKMYRRAFCRPVPMVYEGKSTTDDGMRGFNYRVDQNFLQRPEINPENACYCPKAGCLPNGLGSIAPCYYDIPIVLSQPHFLNTDPIVLSKITGLQADKEKHDTTLTLHPHLGIPLRAKLRIQINLDVGVTRYNSRTKPFNNLVLPLFWLELVIKDTPPIVYYADLFLYHILPVSQQILVILLGVVGLLMMSSSAIVALFFSKEQPNTRLSFRTNYSPLPIIPMSSQHFKTDMKILK